MEVKHLERPLEIRDKYISLANYIQSKGWNDITEIIVQPWGGKTFSLTTIDGYTINILKQEKNECIT